MATTARVKRLLGAKKAGHAGTLDPLASGVLPIAVGHTTRLIPFLLRADKAYRFTVAWGYETTTEDSMGQPTHSHEYRPTEKEIRGVLPLFLGVIQQRPPAYSALKVQGTRAYTLARQNTEMELAPRSVLIKNLILLETAESSASFEVTCGTGTYVRSLARDIARALHTRGHVCVLQRIQVGPFTLSGCHDLDFFEKMGHKEREAVLLPPQTVLDDIPVYVVGEKERDALWQGRAVSCTIQEAIVACMYEGQLVALAKAEEGRLCPFQCLLH